MVLIRSLRGRGKMIFIEKEISVFRTKITSDFGAIDKQYDAAFAVDGAKIDSTVYIRMPNDWAVKKAVPVPVAVPLLSAKEVAVVGTAALVAKNSKVTRRFWSWCK